MTQQQFFERVLTISKLMFFRSGRSEKHLLDIRGILAVSGSSLDAAHLDRWIAAPGLEREWNAIRRTP